MTFQALKNWVLLFGDLLFNIWLCTSQKYYEKQRQIQNVIPIYLLTIGYSQNLGYWRSRSIKCYHPNSNKMMSFGWCEDTVNRKNIRLIFKCLTTEHQRTEQLTHLPKPSPFPALFLSTANITIWHTVFWLFNTQ